MKIIQFNGIEEVFSIAKRIIKGRRLSAIFDNENIDLKQVIEEAFDSIDRLKIAHCI